MLLLSSKPSNTAHAVQDKDQSPSNGLEGTIQPASGGKYRSLLMSFLSSSLCSSCTDLATEKARRTPTLGHLSWQFSLPGLPSSQTLTWLRDLFPHFLSLCSNVTLSTKPITCLKEHLPFHFLYLALFFPDPQLPSNILAELHILLCFCASFVLLTPTRM